MKNIIYRLLLILIFLSACQSELLYIGDEASTCERIDLNIDSRFKNPFVENLPSEKIEYSKEWQWIMENDTLKVFSRIKINDTTTTKINMFKFIVSDVCANSAINKTYEISDQGSVILENTIEKDFVFFTQSYSKNNFLIGRANFTDGSEPVKIFIEFGEQNEVLSLVE
ncbi:hypothetical protein OD91_2523 [Lutibacter sp. Hel_I_33_5]|uniref:hypothetical protein n=1 Tax=Lutibacter sp. Hel_I_33_5 TaxID=1566289 RepID=UPI00119EE747|nr:hypothetical protein [Lutibacter sp. Hel_I_33_5]TVZ57208.1 hypothetical protein OD91_2523 [Lutibacter sp. Hel_I_33_5]